MAFKLKSSGLPFKELGSSPAKKDLGKGLPPYSTAKKELSKAVKSYTKPPTSKAYATKANTKILKQVPKGSVED